MYKALNPGAIGVQATTLQQAIAAAQQGGFEGVECNVREVADLVDLHGAEYVTGLFAEANLKPAGWSVGIDWRSEARWKQGLNELSRLAAAAAAIGCPRALSGVMPGSNDYTFDENYRLHVERFTPIARILADNGCSLGLEFISPKTLRAKLRYPFLYTMAEVLELGSKIGSNVGVLLDIWHWYTSYGTLEEIRTLRREQVVYVHVNDAPAGIHVDEQIDSARDLPGATGVLDVVGFLHALRDIGYDGPVTPEPFKKELKDLPSDVERLVVVNAAMDTIFQQAGIR
ncbi:MAG: sugar phosphate isomerase/epimerase family protein [Roseiflexaceae bacterium]